MGSDTPTAAHFTLSTGSTHLRLPLPFDIAVQLVTRCEQERQRLSEQELGELLTYRLLGALVEPQNSDRRPPTAAQLKYALDLAARYRLEIPSDALKYRSVMGRFLSAYAYPIHAVASKQTELQSGMLDILRVIAAALAVNSNQEHALGWYLNHPISDFECQTPAELVSKGRADAVLRYIASIQDGATG